MEKKSILYDAFEKTTRKLSEKEQLNLRDFLDNLIKVKDILEAKEKVE